jgi:hypothetical protein
MFWKLFATMVAMSDTGSVAMTQIATDFSTRPACERAAQELFPESFERDLNGHHLVMRSAAECRLGGGDRLSPPPPVQPLPPPLPPQVRLPGQMLPWNLPSRSGY